jgi:protein-tyrosine phosphatase
MDEENYSQQYVVSCESYNHSPIKYPLIEHESVVAESSNPTLHLEAKSKSAGTAKKTLALPCADKGSKRKGKMLALDMSQVSTAVTSIDDDEPRSCDVAIQSSYADNQCSKVTEFLYVGSENIARQKDLLLEKGITHIVNCSATTSPNFFEDTFTYMTLKLNDSPKEDVLQLFKEVVAFITLAVANSGRIFIHCQRGVSRGPTIALSYLMWERGLTYEEAYPLMKSARSVCCPNPGFVFQLLEWEHQLKLMSPCLSPSLSPSPGGYNRVAEFNLSANHQTCKSVDIRLLSRDKVSCS